MRKVYCVVLLMGCSLSWPLAHASAQTLTLDQRVAALEAKLKCVTVEENELYVTGCNIHIRNGMNATNVKNSTGNLIIGYNEARQEQGVNDRDGSHNLVIGAEHVYTSTRGLVAGFQNRLFGLSASVTGGMQNTAGGPYTSISGGSEHYAGGTSASISGGSRNTTRGDNSSISGGIANTAEGPFSSVSGGGTYDDTVSGNKALGDFASVSGGYNNQALANYTSISGGSGQTISTTYEVVMGDLTVKTLTITGP